MAAAEEDFSSLPLRDRLTHKVWKARLEGYEEALKVFPTLEPDQLCEYESIISQFVGDSNANAQTKGVEAAVCFAENAKSVKGWAAGVAEAIVSKCAAASKQATKDKATELIILLIEGDVAEPIVEELLKGYEHKTPKAVAAVASMIKAAVCAFGAKVVPAKPILKATPKLLAHVNKEVRDSAKDLIVELYRWLGEAIKPSLADIKPVQLTELEEMWTKLPQEKPTPTHYLKSAQKNMKKGEAAGASAEPSTGAKAAGGKASASAAAAESDDGPGMDAYDLADPTNIISAIPKTFDSDLQESKWSVRRDALQAVLDLAGAVKLADGDYGDLVRACKHVIAADSNVVNVALAANIIGALARGLRNRFSSYGPLVFEAILEKYKEKKSNVVTALNSALDHMIPVCNIDRASEELTTALKNKNPDVKSNVASVIARVFPAKLSNDAIVASLKALGPALVECINDSTPAVRDTAALALGAIQGAVGEKPLKKYTASLDKAKIEKITKASEAAAASAAASSHEPTSKAASASALAAKPKSAPGKPFAAAAEDAKSRPGTSAASGPAGAKRPSKSAAGGDAKPAAGKKAGSATALAAAIEEPAEADVTPEDAESRIGSVAPAAIITLLKSEAWKERLEGATNLAAHIKAADSFAPDSALVVAKYIEGVSKGWKETNFQIMSALFDCLTAMAANCEPKFPERCAHNTIPVLVVKLGDIKTKTSAAAALSAFCEAISVNFVFLRVCDSLQSQKGPKVITEGLGWLGETVKAFGFKAAVKPMVALAKAMLESPNAAIRSATFEFLATLRIFVGASFISLFKDERPAVVTSIEEAFAKVESEKPPAPTKFEKGDRPDASEDGAGAGTDGAEGTGKTAASGKGASKKARDPMEDLVERVNLADLVKPTLIEQMGDAAWKVRGEAMEALGALLNKNPHIQSELGDLAPALKARLADSNKNILMTTLVHIASIAKAMGQSIKRYQSVFFESIFVCLADGKDTMRNAAIATMDAWCDKAGVSGFVEAEETATALASGKPFEQTALLAWLADKIGASDEPGNVAVLIKPVFASLEDRSADVRKAAQILLPHVIARVGLDKVKKACAKLQPSSQKAVQGFIDKAASEVPAKKAPAAAVPTDALKPTVAASVVSGDGESEDDKRTKAATSKTTPAAATASAAGSKKGTANGKKEDEAATTAEVPMLSGDGKSKRIKDDKNLKILKWNFAAPRDEFTQQLQEQMAPTFGKTLLHQLFSTNFRDHILAVDTLLAAVTLPEAPFAVEAVDNLDLLLKWVTLRFFDTNTSVLLKVMQFVENLFETVVTKGYELSDYEASSFLPYLVMKVGDKLENVRKDCHSIFRVMTKCYPASKLFNYVMEGLKSKNAKQRSECLIELGTLIERHSMSVCQIGAPKALKAIAFQISDRDNTVRSAALDAIVVCYNFIGEDVHKLMGPINDKDLALVVERIKRSGKRPGDAGGATQDLSTIQADAPLGGTLNKTATLMDKSMPRAQSGAQANIAPSVPQEFHLDFDLNAIDLSPSSLMPDLAPTSLEDLLGDGPAGVAGGAPTGFPAGAPTANVQSGALLNASLGLGSSTGIPSISRSARSMRPVAGGLSGESETDAVHGSGSGIPPPRQRSREALSASSASLSTSGIPSLGQSQRRESHGSSTILTLPRESSLGDGVVTMDDIVAKVSHANITTSIQALKVAEDLAKDASPTLVPHVNALLTACCMQLRLVFTVHLEENSGDARRVAEIVRLCKHLLSCLMHIFTAKIYAMEVTTPVMQEVVMDLVTRLLDGQMDKLEEGAQVSRALNMILLKTLENSNKDVVFTVLVRILSLSVEGSVVAQSRFTELIMKCIWKLTKALPSMIEEMSVDSLLLEVHKFLVSHPPAIWKPGNDGTPLRTMKTLVHTLVKIQGANVLRHLTLVGTEPLETAVGSYLMLMLEKSGQTTDELKALVPKVAAKHESPVVMRRGASHEARPRSQIPRSPSMSDFTAYEAEVASHHHSSGVSEEANVPKTISEEMTQESAHDTVMAILGKVTSKDTTREGLADLRNFQGRYPNIDIKPFLKELSPFMQKYVERRMDEQEPPSPHKTSPVRPKLSGEAPVGGLAAPSSAADYLEKLRALQRNVSSAAVPAPQPVIPQPIVVPQAMQEDLEVPSVMRSPLARKENAPAPSTSSASNLDSLKARLAKMKQAQAQTQAPL